jgi:hypothetical protein
MKSAARKAQAARRQAQKGMKPLGGGAIVLLARSKAGHTKRSDQRLPVVNGRYL